MCGQKVKLLGFGECLKMRGLKIEYVDGRQKVRAMIEGLHNVNV